MLENGGADIAMQVDPDTAKTINSPDVTVTMAPSYQLPLFRTVSPGAKDAPVPPPRRSARPWAMPWTIRAPSI